MACAIITLNKLLDNNSALLAFGLELSNDFFANPAWNEMIFLDEEDQICLHPFGRYCKGMLGKRIVLPMEFLYDKEKKTLASFDGSVVLKNKDGNLCIRQDCFDDSMVFSTQMMFGYEKEHFRAEVLSHVLEIRKSLHYALLRAERFTSYFHASGIEMKRDQATSTEYFNSHDQQASGILKNPVICEKYDSTFDTLYSSRDCILLPGGSSITRFTCHRDETRPDISWIGPKEDGICVHLAKSSSLADSRLVMGNGDLILPKEPEELDPITLEMFVQSASGPIDTRIQLAKMFGEKGSTLVTKLEKVLHKK